MHKDCILCSEVNWVAQYWPGNILYLGKNVPLSYIVTVVGPCKGVRDKIVSKAERKRNVTKEINRK